MSENSTHLSAESSAELSPRFFQTFFTYVYLLGGTAFLGLLVIVASLIDRSGYLWWPWMIQLWARLLLLVGGATEIHTEGTEQLQHGVAAIVMCNHESHFDVPLLIRSSPGPLRFLTKNTLFYFPIFGQAMWLTGFVPIDRGNSAKARKSIDKAAELIAGGRMILIFPEGTRSRTGEMIDFKKGGFVLAVKSGVPIIPAGLAGTRRILPPGWWCTGRGRVALKLGKPIETKGYTLENKGELMEKVRREITKLREQAREVVREKRAEELPGY